MVGPRAFYDRVGLSISPFNARLIHFFRVFLHACDVTFKLLRESTLYFGHNPRQCFDASYPQARLEAKKGDVVQAITRLAREPSEILWVLYKHHASADEISDTIFHFIPTNEFRQFEISECVPVSPWVFDSLLNACEKKEADTAT